MCLLGALLSVIEVSIEDFVQGCSGFYRVLRGFRSGSCKVFYGVLKGSLGGGCRVFCAEASLC